jgi:hypothetical protein
MSRAIGLAGTFFAGVRVAGELTYIPAHIKNGKKINSRCLIPVYRNSNKGTNAKTGEKGRTDSFKLVSWGKLADTCCRSLPQGKAIDAFAEPQSFKGSLFNADGSLRVDAAGVAIETTKVSFTILNIVFGEESNKRIAEEIQLGRRPQFWNVPNHADYQLWTQMLQAKQQLVWDGQNAKFGYSRVVIPNGQGITLDFSTPAAPLAAAPLVAPAAALPGMVAHVANTMAPPINPNVVAPIAPVTTVAPVTAAPAMGGQALF